MGNDRGEFRRIRGDVLAAVYHSGGSVAPSPIRRIAATLRKDAAAVSQALQDLALDGLVRLERGGEDRQQRRILAVAMLDVARVRAMLGELAADTLAKRYRVPEHPQPERRNAALYARVDALEVRCLALEGDVDLLKRVTEGLLNNRDTLDGTEATARGARS